MHIDWKHLAYALAALPVAAVLFAWIGFFNVGASSGHWRITDWFLHFAMRSAVRTYALAIERPEALPLDAVLPAVGHYARGCSICHGAPGEPRSPAVLRMLPPPPDLATVVPEWSDEELFRIVKHGVRFSGMPAWPAQERDDEVWAMVAFLRDMPGMDAGRYRDLAYGVPPASGGTDQASLLAECARCHGADGQGRSAAVPVLAGQSEAYLMESLRAYASGARPSGIMALPATAAPPEAWAGLARHYAALPPAPSASAPSPELLGAGRQLAERGAPERGVPACLTCHGAGHNPVWPSLDRQHLFYLENQLRLFRDGKRGGTAYSAVMTQAAKGLTDSDITAAAAYFAARAPAIETAQ